MTNNDLGYDNFFEEDKKNQGFSNYDVARVISEHRGLYILKNSMGEYVGRVRGKQMFEATSRYDYPVVGDWVVITILDDKQVAIELILKRKTIISRNIEDRSRNNKMRDVQVISSNIDVAFIVQSVDRDYNLNRFERYISIAENGGVRSILILNKIDLISSYELNIIKQEISNRFNNISVITVSTLDESSLEEIYKNLEKNKTYCFLGSSGVGKSSIIEKLTNNKKIRINDLSEYSNRGRHTTTERQMYFTYNGSILIDNPGIRAVGTSGISDFTEYFDDISSIKSECKFSNCTHTHEPGCSVLKKIEQGKLNKEKYSNYLNMKKEEEYFEMSDYEKRKKDKNFGKMVKNVLKNKRDNKFN